MTYKILHFTKEDLRRLIPPNISNTVLYIQTGGITLTKTYTLKRCGIIDCLSPICSICKTARASWARAVKERDNYTCHHCGTTDHVHAHHLLQKINFPERSFDISNGVTLCEQCHHKAHAARKAQ